MIKNIFKMKWRREWRKKEMMFLLEQLETYISSGLAIDACLSMIEAGAPRRQHEDLKSVRIKVESGGRLSASLAEHIGLPRSLSGIIEHGERVGGLAAALRSVHGLLTREDELKKKCLSALTYPVVIGILALVLTIGLVRGIIPQIIPMLTGMRVELPLLTKVTIWLSDVVTAYGLYIFLGIPAASFFAVFSYKKSFQAKLFAQRLILVTPIIGRLYFLYSLSIFLRSLGTLVNSGISIASAYPEVARSISFEPLKIFLISSVESITNGASVSAAFYGKMIPPFVASLVTAGEVSGSLGESMSRSADIIDSSLEHSLKRLTSLVEPVMMVGVGGVVGSIALSIMMPIYDMSKVLQHMR